MPTTITLDLTTYDRLRLVAAALDTSESEAVARLLDRLASAPATAQPALPTSQLIGSDAIHVVYKGQRVDAEYDRASQAIKIVSGSLAGKVYGKPSQGARAVVAEIAPGVNPERNGWGFWIVNATGETLQSLRYTRS